MRVRDIPVDLIWKMAGIGALTLVTALALLGVLRLIVQPLGILLAGIIIAMALAPVVALLERWLPRLAAILLVYVVLLLIVAGIGWALLPPLVVQVRDAILNWEAFVAIAEGWIERFGFVDTDQVMNTLSGQTERIASLALMVPMEIASRGFEIILVIFTSLYWLISLPALRSFTLSFFPVQRRERAAEVLSAMGQTMGGYVRGVTIDGLILATIVYVGLTIIGVEYALLLALVAFLGELVPVLGPILAAIPALIIAFLDSPTQGLIVLVFYIVVQQIEAYVILPYIMQGQAHLPPLLVILALFAGGTAGGILGALIAIPLSGAALVLVNEVIAPAARSWTGAAGSDAPGGPERGLPTSLEEDQRDQPQEQRARRRREAEAG